MYDTAVPFPCDLYIFHVNSGAARWTLRNDLHSERGLCCGLDCGTVVGMMGPPPCTCTCIIYDRCSTGVHFERSIWATVVVVCCRSVDTQGTCEYIVVALCNPSDLLPPETLLCCSLRVHTSKAFNILHA